MIGRTGIYELNDDIVIKSLRFQRPKNYILNKELVDELKKNNIWSVYFNCGLWIDSISNNETLQEIIKYKYNKLYDTNKTYNQIIKLMKTQYNKFKKKFDSYVPKITLEILYNNEQKLSKK